MYSIVYTRGKNQAAKTKKAYVLLPASLQLIRHFAFCDRLCSEKPVLLTWMHTKEKLSASAHACTMQLCKGRLKRWYE